jgi:hypothetical protein
MHKSFCNVPDLTVRLDVSREIFIEVFSAQFNGNPSSGSCADTYGQTGRRTDGKDESNIRFSRSHLKYGCLETKYTR